MNSITVDASIVLKWISIKNEPYLDKAQDLFNSAVERKIILCAPTLLKLEVTNILLKKKKLTTKECQKALNIIQNANISYVELTDTLVNDSTEKADRYNLSVYDGIYVAVSEFLGNQLLSADEKGHGKIKNVLLLKDFEIGKFL